MSVDKQKRNARQYSWQVENRDKINLLVPKGVKADLQRRANEEHITVTELINRAIRRELDRPCRYGMRLRGYAPGCQPMDGLIEGYDDPGGTYHSILVYGRKLTDQECADYELDFLGRV